MTGLISHGITTIIFISVAYCAIAVLIWFVDFVVRKL